MCYIQIIVTKWELIAEVFQIFGPGQSLGIRVFGRSPLIEIVELKKSRGVRALK